MAVRHSFYIATLVLFLAVMIRVRPGSDALYMSGDAVNVWPADDLYWGDLRIWANQNGGEPNGYMGALAGWVGWQTLRFLGFDIGSADGIWDALPRILGSVGIYSLCRLARIEVWASYVAGVYFAFSVDWALNNAVAANWTRGFAPLMLVGVWRVNSACLLAFPSVIVSALSILVVVYSSLAFQNLPQVVVCLCSVFVFVLANSLWVMSNAEDTQWFISNWLKSWSQFVIEIALYGGWLWVAYWFVWIGPIFGVGGAFISTPVAVSDWAFSHGRASFDNLFLGFGYWGWGGDYFGIVYEMLNGRSMRIIMLAPFACYLLISFAKGDSSRKLLMAVMLLILFLMKGLHEPFRSINEGLYLKVPWLILIREPVAKLSFIWSTVLAMMIAYMVRDSVNNGHYWWRKFTPVVCVLLGVAIVLGVAVREISGIPTAWMPPRWVELPRDWLAARQFVVSSRLTELGRTVVLPRNNSYAVPYVWGVYAVDSLPERFLGLSQVQSAQRYTSSNRDAQEITNELYEALEGEISDCNEIYRLARKIGVKSALLRFDIGSGDARPLGSGQAVVTQVNKELGVMLGCGWETIWVSESLRVLRLRDADRTQPLPLGMVGDSVTVGLKDSKKVAGTRFGLMDGAGVWEVAITSTVPQGLGFFLMPCGYDACGVWDWLKYWSAVNTGACAAAVGSNWCEWSVESLPVGTYSLQNSWEHLIWVLGSLSVGSVVSAGVLHARAYVRGLGMLNVSTQ
jgi:hypothetical protein